MDKFILIVSFAASLCSIYGLVLTVKDSNSCRIKWLSGISGVLIVALSIVSHLYIGQIDAENAIERRNANMQYEAAYLLETLPYASYWSPGESEGIVISVGILLEKYQDIIPEAFSLYRNICNQQI